MISKLKNVLMVLLIVLKPLSAECHVIVDQSSEIIFDTPKVISTFAYAFIIVN